MDTHNERTAATVTVSFLNEAGQAETPQAASYRIDCKTTGTAILGWTNISSPAAVQAIAITAEQNRIIDDANPAEIRTVTVKSTDATGREMHSDFEYRVRNLRFAP